MFLAIPNAIISAIPMLLLGLYISTPGWHRALTPWAFGVTQVAPDIYSDAPERGPEFERMVAKAKTNAEKFFVTTRTKPIYIFCTKRPCHETFGSYPTGLAMGFHRVMIAPSGIKQNIVNHEQVHIELHRYVNSTNFLQPRFPAWFDEGLAEHLSGQPRFFAQVSSKSKSDVQSAITFGDWNTLVRRKGPAYAYSAAQSLVTNIMRQTGRDGMLEIIQTTKSRSEFMRALPDVALNRTRF
ncbi:hypothetical protein GCM10008927_14140 [Amylibacter ulvae]|uniref:Peptidase MA-like domain-containing protein n=1 Tax=Paramylibacter ulvae TaxID=1651968 RepID=A0ABQ3CYN7_9RHOB|nr:hypothetical protein [Amylibacter ulvae]GHA50305.1 hypothetical protein GCM10008927_14140 [Amylibacter ulvae]